MTETAKSRAQPLRTIRYAEPRIVGETLADGSLLLRSTEALRHHEPSLARMFRTAVERAPARDLFMERNAEGGWRRVTYAEARVAADALAQNLIDRGLSAQRPLMILSGNGIDHGLLTLAAYTAGIPLVPVSVAYSLQSQDFAKLTYIAELMSPGLVYVSDTAPFAKALGALNLDGVAVAAGRNGANLQSVIALDDMLRTTPGPAVEQAMRETGAETIAKFLFTSGSTSLPKGVINTHGMLTANQQQAAQVWPWMDEQPCVLVDWLPWNHTFGGNHNFNLVLRHAGTLVIDGGKPVPGLVEQSIRNLADMPPTVYFNVPAGFAALLPFLERDADFARAFFSRLRLILYAAAALPKDIWERLEAASSRACGAIVPMTSSWGSTETAPIVTSAHFPIDRAGPIGVPVPGVDLKLTPAGDKLEARVRGPNVTPGYWKRADLTAAAYDADGFYKMGDALRLIDPHDLNQGVVFDGRLAEDFKLTTGTWVTVGALRVGALGAASPVLQDAVVAGENRDRLGLLAWLNLAACQGLIGAGAPADLAALARHPRVRAHVRDGLARWNAEQKGSSQQIARVILLADTPSIDANEITDKGYVNQRLALERRKADVERLFAVTPDEGVIVVAAATQ